MEPWRDRSAPSPPVEPPGVKSAFIGCVVNPHRGFSVSHHYLESAFVLEISVAQERYHDTLRQIGFCNDDSSELFEYVDEQSIRCCGGKGAGDVAKG